MGKLLAAVEDAPLVAAADAVGDLLAQMMGASEVALLIADFSGEKPIRLGHAGSVWAPASHRSAKRLPERSSTTGDQSR